MYLAIAMFLSSLLIAICYIRAFYKAIREAQLKESLAAKMVQNVHNIKKDNDMDSDDEIEGYSSRRNSYQ